jgi:hypothetical protein
MKIMAMVKNARARKARMREGLADTVWEGTPV